MLGMQYSSRRRGNRAVKAAAAAATERRTARSGPHSVRISSVKLLGVIVSRLDKRLVW
jgi:hypothetical protein